MPLQNLRTSLADVELCPSMSHIQVSNCMKTTCFYLAVDIVKLRIIIIIIIVIIIIIIDIIIVTIIVKDKARQVKGNKNRAGTKYIIINIIIIKPEFVV